MKNVRYEFYSDFLHPTLQDTFSTLECRREYEKWSEVWIERVEIAKDGTETRKEVH